MDAKESILIVDDDEGIRKSLALILIKKGYLVESAATGKEALAIAKGKPVYLTLLDIKLPDIGGLALLSLLKQTNPDMSVIMITGFASVESAVQSLTAGASGYITKPIDLDGLLARIEASFDHQHLVTENKRTEQALKVSEMEFRSLAEAMPQIVWITRADGRNIYFNQQWVDYTGLTLEESYGDGWNIPFHPDDRQRAWDAWQRATHHNDTYSMECRLRRADGAYRWWLIRGVPQRNANGEILKWFGTCTDIDEIKQVDEKLKESEKFLTNIVEHIPDMIFVKDARDLRFVRFNKAAEDLLGYSRAEMLGKNDYDLFPKEEADLFTGNDREVLRTNKLSENPDEKMKTRFNGERIIHTKKIPIADEMGDPRYLLGISEDITDRKFTEKTLVRVNQKLNVITNLTRRDLTSEVFVLASYLKVAKKQAAGQDHILETLEKCEQAISSINDITEFTRDFQDMGVKPPQWQNVKMVFLFGLSHVTMGEIRNCIETETLEIFADPLLEKVCQRIFENSLVHGEHVTRIHIWYTATPDGLTIFIEDDGIGILQEIKEKLFSKDDVTHGPMRSLIFAREILDITGITIRETGEPGRGARFEIFVPNGVWRTTRKGT